MSPARLPRQLTEIELIIVCVVLVVLSFVAGLTFNGCLTPHPHDRCHRSESFRPECKNAP